MTVWDPPDRATSLVGSVPVTSIIAVASLVPPCGSVTVYLNVSMSVWLFPKPSKAAELVGSYSNVPSLEIVTVTPLELTTSPAMTSRLL